MQFDFDAFAGSTGGGVFSPFYEAKCFTQHTFYFMEVKFMKASIAIQVLPVAQNQDETLRIIDEVIAYIKSSGLHCHVGPFETTIEGESYDQLMDIVKECQHVAVRAGARSVSAYVKVAYRPEGELLTIDRKIKKHAEA